MNRTTSNGLSPHTSTSSIDIEWIRTGPSRDEVEAVVDKYKSFHQDRSWGELTAEQIEREALSSAMTNVLGTVR